MAEIVSNPPLDKYKDGFTSMAELLKSDPTVTAEFIKMVMVAYEGRGPVAASLRHIKRSPLLVGSMADLPPAVFLICGKDPLCDEGIVYSKRLAEAIGEDKVKLHIYPSALHMFRYSLPECDAARKLAKDLEDGLAWLLYETS